MGNAEQETLSSGTVHEHEFNRVIGATGVPGPDEEKEVTFGCADTQCEAEEVRKGKIF